jgi:hypothetical protein
MVLDSKSMFIMYRSDIKGTARKITSRQPQLKAVMEEIREIIKFLNASLSEGVYIISDGEVLYFDIKLYSFGCLLVGGC